MSLQAADGEHDEARPAQAEESEHNNNDMMSNPWDADDELVGMQQDPMASPNEL